ncbi:hypothetical protein TYRP_021923 [Tyrophagus putrescentiae]|nr:hypothetical protein TYRP_021923 [Tyrophagus putrescentiae]
MDERCLVSPMFADTHTPDTVFGQCWVVPAADGKKVEQHQRTTGQLGGKDEDDEEEVKELQNEKGSGYHVWELPSADSQNCHRQISAVVVYLFSHYHRQCQKACPPIGCRNSLGASH